MTKPPDYADMEVVGHVATRAGGLAQLAGLRRASTPAWWRWMAGAPMRRAPAHH